MQRRGDVLPTMGPREFALMEILWARSPEHLQVREVAELLGEDLAYTTVMTLLARLHDKGLLGRRRQGRGYAYRPTISHSEYAARSMSEAMERGDDVEDVLLRFVGSLTAEEQAVLREMLERER